MTRNATRRPAKYRIPKSWLFRRISLKGFLHECHPKHNLDPYTKAKWKNFMASYHSGDEIWRFAGSVDPKAAEESRPDLGLRAGFAIVRHGRVIRAYRVCMS